MQEKSFNALRSWLYRRGCTNITIKTRYTIVVSFITENNIYFKCRHDSLEVIKEKIYLFLEEVHERG